MRMKIVSALRAVYTYGLASSLMVGAIASFFFLAAFVLGSPLSIFLCQAGLGIMHTAIPVVALAVACGLAVVYLDPDETHSFSMDQSSGEDGA